MKFKLTLLLCLGAIALAVSRPAVAQCEPNNDLCRAMWSCYGSTRYSEWYPYNSCVATQTQTGVCIAFKVTSGVQLNVACVDSTMTTRGVSNDVLASIFDPARPIQDDKGKLIEIDPASGELLQVATSINALQARGAPIGKDVNAAFKDAGIPVVDSVSVEVADDSETGERQFTLRGANSDDPVVLRFDERGQAIQEEQGPPPPEVLEKIEAMKRAND
jgi:hypothetical protein